MVALLRRPSKYNDDQDTVAGTSNKAIAGIAKQHNGPTGSGIGIREEIMRRKSARSGYNDSTAPAGVNGRE